MGMVYPLQARFDCSIEACHVMRGRLSESVFLHAIFRCPINFYPVPLSLFARG
jgi:hypothetical protein